MIALDSDTLALAQRFVLDATVRSLDRRQNDAALMLGMALLDV